MWAEWKSSQLALLFKELKEKAKTVNPKIKFAANVYYETPVDEAAAMAWYSQKLSTLKSAGADYFAVMGYFEQISSEQKLGPSFFFKKCSRIFITAFCIFYYKIILKKYSVYFIFC